ncbi:MAG: ATP-dependent helicase [Ruminococcus sp.]|nr:ATP-dependent helicase [Ruminococcus sp.]
METVPVITDDNRDDTADEIIDNCLSINKPKSFFMFAGAGSGKTRSLVKALNSIKTKIGTTLLQSGRKVAVITYTNAASEEIKQRAQYNPLFEISTIHSFSWSLISAYTNDIRDWLKAKLEKRIDELTQQQSKSRSKTTKTYLERAEKIVKRTERLRYLDTVKRFIYNPDGLNLEANSLDHAEVIQITADFLTSKPTFKAVFIDKYPIVLIDESQDTKKELISVLFSVQQEYKDRFLLGLFGDTMQRIYLDGKEDLAESIPDDWEKPCKVMNHRSQKRIVDLCNDIRKDADGIQQCSRTDKPNGIVRVFITDNEDAFACEQIARNRMSRITGDNDWEDIEKIKSLTIEHKMAASRLGFKSFFDYMNNVNSYKQGLVKGDLSVISLFTHILIPLQDAYYSDNQFEIMRIIREHSIDFDRHKDSLTSGVIESLKQSVEELLSLLSNEHSTCRDLLNIVYEKRLFQLHKDLLRLLEDFPSEDDNEYDKYINLKKALDSEFIEIKRYYTYVQGKASFDTHQGVKGLEFDRVMVIIDDKESKGTTFSYNRLFGVEDKTERDRKNEREGRETSVDRTRRLLYVTCSRAKESLAIVYYTPSIDDTYKAILSTDWFTEEEIEALRAEV